MTFSLRFLRAPALSLILLPALAWGCGSAEEPASAADEPVTAAAAEEAAPDPLRELDIDGAAALFAEGEAHPVDANSNNTRTNVGCVPGATLLTSSSQYEMDELPADGLLVFYCGSTQCTASDNAASRAREAGREVAIMRPGIRGWVDEGQPTTRPEEGATTAPSDVPAEASDAEGTPS